MGVSQRKNKRTSCRDLLLVPSAITYAGLTMYKITSAPAHQVSMRCHLGV